MVINLRKILFLLISIAAFLAIYLEFDGKIKLSLGAHLVFLLLSLLVHITTDRPQSKIFTFVLILFSGSALLELINQFMLSRTVGIIYAYQALMIIGFVYMLRAVIKECRKEFVIKNYSWPVVLILSLDGIIIYKIMLLVDQFQLGWSHVLFGFAFTIVKLLVLSVGLIYYYLSSYKTRKVSLLVGALAVFFASDVVETSNYLFFFDNPLLVGRALHNVLSMLGVVLFYMYCTYPKQKGFLDF